MARTLLELVTKTPEGQEDAAVAPLGGTRAQATQRLQIGLSGIAAMVLMIALADTILSRAEQSEASAVPEAAATVEPVASDTPKNDPLAEAGVVPDLPASPTPDAGASSSPTPLAQENAGAEN